MQRSPEPTSGGFITPSRASPEESKFIVDPPLSTKREKLLRGTPTRYRIPPAPPRLMKSAPTMNRYYINRSYIEPYARIVSFKRPEEQPKLSSRYRPELEENYLQQCFVIQGRLGQGDFGEVVGVRSKNDGKLYAVKCSLEIYRNTADRREKLQEVQKHELLPPHTNLIHFVKAWEERGRLYIQTEWCCHSLDDIAMERHEIPEPEIWYYLIDILMALEHMHSHDLIHVDIKPSNIFITSDGICKLGDFGLVFDLNKDDPRNITEGDSKYLAAEVLNDKPTKAADIFSLGITILELATDLELPMNGIFWHEIRNRMIDEHLINQISADLRRVLAWMMDPNPLNRPKASELLSDPILRKHKLHRRFILIKHKLYSAIADRLSFLTNFLSSGLYYIFLPFIWLFHSITNKFIEPKIITPYSKGRNMSFSQTRDRTPEFNIPLPNDQFGRPPLCSTPFRHRLNFDDQTYSDNENGRSPANRTTMSLPSEYNSVGHSNIHASPYALYTGSGDSPTSSRQGSTRKRGPRRTDELFGIERKHLRKSQENEEELND